jgi:hypothetical protein
MSDLFFDTPYWILGALAIVGVALFVMGNNRTDTQMRNIGLGVVAVGILMFLVSWIVDTSEEKCLKRTRQLVEAVEKRDWDTFNSLVLPRCRLTIMNVPGVSLYRNREEMLEGAKAGVEQYDLKTARIFSSEVRSNPDYIAVDISVFSTQGQGIVQNLRTDWELDWQETENGWMCSEIIAKQIANQSGERVRRLFPPAGPQPERPPGWGRPGFGRPQ